MSKEPQCPTGGRGHGTPGGATQRGGYYPSPQGYWRSQNAVETGRSPLTHVNEDATDDPTPLVPPNTKEKKKKKFWENSKEELSWLVYSSVGNHELLRRHFDFFLNSALPAQPTSLILIHNSPVNALCLTLAALFPWLTEN